MQAKQKAERQCMERRMENIMQVQNKDNWKIKVFTLVTVAAIKCAKAKSWMQGAHALNVALEISTE